MKHKNRTVCNNCRRRKLGCDGKQPECGQCVLSRRACDGYSTAWTFIQQGFFIQARQRNTTQIKRLDSSPRSVGFPRESSAIISIPPQISNPPASNHLLNVIVENYLPESERNTTSTVMGRGYPRICGTWVDVLSELPCLVHRQSLISKTVTALAAAVLASVTVSGQSFSDPYLVAIRSLRQTLQNGGATTYELIPAIMCLILVEVMIPNATTALDAHLNAIGAFFESCGPIAVKSGLLHKLFVGFRPLMIIHAIQYRQPTFLSLPAWTETPFSDIPPSIMQIFLSEFAHLPSLLYRMDCLFAAPQPSQSDIDEVSARFAEVSARLDHWEHSFKDSQSFWYCQDIHKDAPDTDQLIYYPNVTMANIFTHLWAFKIICSQELAIARSSRAPSSPPSPTIPEATAMILARQISLSMDYLLKEDMGLFGPASSPFPLHVAWHTLKYGGKVFDRVHIEGIVDRLVQRGLLSAPALVFGS